MYLGHNLRLFMDLLRGSPPSIKMGTEEYVRKLRGQLEELHQEARHCLDIKSKNMKTWYDCRTKGVFFERNEKV